MAYGIGNRMDIWRAAWVRKAAPGGDATPGGSKVAAALPGWRRRDLWIVLALTGLAYTLAGRVEFSESFGDWALGHERWQADELPFTLLVLCAGLLWYGWRRDRETALLLRRNRDLARHLMQVQEDERRRLARELHDEFGQHCSAIRFEAQCLQRGLADSAAAATTLAASAQAIGASAEALQQGVRRLLRQLRPAALDSLGLDAALDELLRDWQLCHRIGVERQGGGAGAVDDAVAITVYRVVQEALTNVARHARATRASLLISRRRDQMLVELADNGVGFGFGPAAAGFGITGMQERAAELGGRLSLATAASGGALLRLQLPLAGGGGR